MQANQAQVMELSMNDHQASDTTNQLGLKPLQSMAEPKLNDPRSS